MAVSPLFYDTREALLATLRLDNLCSDADSQAMIDRALLKVQAGLFEALGSDKIAELSATGYVEQATTQAESDRARVQIVESEGAHAELLCLLPSLFVAKGSSGIDIYQDENPFRLDPGGFNADRTRKKLMDSVWSLLAELGADDIPQSNRFALVEPEEESLDTMDLLGLPSNTSIFCYYPKG